MAGKSLTASAAEIISTSRPMALAWLMFRCNSLNCAGVEARRRLPTWWNSSELAEELDAVLPDLHQGGRGVELRDQAGGEGQLPRGQVELFDQDDVGPAKLGEMVGDAHPHDSAADDDDTSLVLHDGLQAALLGMVGRSRRHVFLASLPVSGKRRRLVEFRQPGAGGPSPRRAAGSCGPNGERRGVRNGRDSDVGE